MFSCKVCIEKDKRIAELKEQIQFFKNMLSPPEKPKQYEMVAEEDALMNGGHNGDESEVDYTAEEAENARLQAEVDFIYSGNNERAEIV